MKPLKKEVVLEPKLVEDATMKVYVTNLLCKKNYYDT